MDNKNSIWRYIVINFFSKFRVSKVYHKSYRAAMSDINEICFKNSSFDDINKISSSQKEINNRNLRNCSNTADYQDVIKYNYGYGKSTESLFNDNHDYNRQKKPIMGKTALLKKTNLEYSDSFIVHSIILNKYEDILNHYDKRRYKRYQSRMSTSDDEFSENSTIPRYSPSTISSLDTTRSISDYEKYLANYDARSYSFDDLNVDTTKQNLNESSLISCSNIDSGLSTSCSEYDPKKFLFNAIGDLTSLNSEYTNCTANTDLKCEESVGTSNVSSLISKTNSICSSLRKGLLRKNSKKIPTETELTNNLTANSPDPLEEYKQQLSRQNSIIFQVSKALAYCKTMKNFSGGKERLEAEKILLVATVTKDALKNEINSIEFDTYRSIFDSRFTGNIEISNLTFHVKSINSDPQAHCKEYFLVIVTSGKNVYCSEISQIENGLLIIQKNIVFENLLADFEIIITVYSLVLSDNDYNSQDQFKCPSPKSIFKCKKESRFARRTLSSNQISFIPTAKCIIRNSDLSNIKSNNLNLTLKDVCESTLEAKFEIKIKSSFRLTNRLSGFLTVGLDCSGNCLTWNRRWCVLEGFSLSYWNYPSEENSAPLGQVDISCCSVQKVVPADRSICARPKTLFIPINSTNGCKKYFLSTDTQSELQLWESELNFVIQSLLIWQEMKGC